MGRTSERGNCRFAEFMNAPTFLGINIWSGPQANGRSPNFLPPGKDALPGTGVTSISEFTCFLRARGQIRYPATTLADAFLGLSRRAYLGAEIAATRFNAGKFRPARPEGAVSEGRNARKTDLVQRA